MADSPTPRPTRNNPCELALRSFLDRNAAQAIGATQIAVAFSGGADSTALLLAATEHWPGNVIALHVHHGLQKAGDDFEVHCKSFCETRGISLVVAHVDAGHASGESPEDAARKARYISLADLAKSNGVDSVLLGQHADDQVETILLALSRGAGLPGLAGMASTFERHGVTFHRPILSVAARDIREWLDDQAIAYVTDPTNADTSFTRNRIRLELLPAIEAAFPQFRETFARSARHAAAAQKMLDEAAEADVAPMQSGDSGTIAIKSLQSLDGERLPNAIRHWLKREHGVMPSAAQLAELVSQIRACTTRGHGIRIKVGQGFVERKGAFLGWYN